MSIFIFVIPCASITTVNTILLLCNKCTFGFVVIWFQLWSAQRKWSLLMLWMKQFYFLTQKMSFILVWKSSGTGVLETQLRKLIIMSQTGKDITEQICTNVRLQKMKAGQVRLMSLTTPISYNFHTAEEHVGPTPASIATWMSMDGKFLECGSHDSSAYFIHTCCVLDEATTIYTDSSLWVVGFYLCIPSSISTFFQNRGKVLYSFPKPR